MKNKDMDEHNIISEKIHFLKNEFKFLSKKEDCFAFSALCIKADFYKNPAYKLTDDELIAMLVDGTGDGGVDAILSDPNADNSDLVLCQSKYYAHITKNDVESAIDKLIGFYKEMDMGNYHSVNQLVKSRFIELNAEVGSESKVHFVFYTSAEQAGIPAKSIVKKLMTKNELDSTKFDISIKFAKDILEDIKESESRRPTVEQGKLILDETNNCLLFNDEAAIVNISAFSLKELYSRYNNALLAKNLRYYIKKKDVDVLINNTIENSPDTFWFKNNGITVICRDFDIDGKEVKLNDFSIVNGGQTTTLISKNQIINKDFDFYLPCKIIKIQGESEQERDQFSLDIAQATNSQKAIKPTDLKANAPEQLRFTSSMRNLGVYYQTKRGEEVPKQFSEDFAHTNLVETGKLALAGVFQLPASSRNKPSSFYCDKYYNKVFSDPDKYAYITKELLYMDYYFRKVFIKRYDKEHGEMPMGNDDLTFSHNARTICISFSALAARYYQENISPTDLAIIFEHVDDDSSYENHIYKIVSNMDDVKTLFPKILFNNKDKLEEILYVLYSEIIKYGKMVYKIAKSSDVTLNETNFLKKDKNYYNILKNGWEYIEPIIRNSFSGLFY